VITKMSHATNYVKNQQEALEFFDAVRAPPLNSSVTHLRRLPCQPRKK